MKRTGMLLAFIMTACASRAGLEGSTWALANIGGNAPVARSNVTLQFSGDSAFGNGGCNQYRASFTSTGSTLSIGPAMSTKRACMEEAMNAQETAYLGALSRVAAYEVTNGRLVLRDASGTAVLEFVRARS